MNEQINIATLTPEQLVALTQQLKAKAKQERKANAGNRDAWKSLVDSMLQEKDGTAFKHTTADMLAALQAKSLVASNLTPDQRAEELKKIQTRKQKLEKMRNDDGTLKYAKGTFGYKASPHVVGPLTLERVLAWIAANPEHKAAIRKAVK